MIRIEKQAPPSELVTYRERLDTSSHPPKPASYDGPGFEVVKPFVRSALVTEQGGLCCYCTDRIEASPTRMKIEHRVAQSDDPTRDLEWSNLLGACCGEIPSTTGRGARVLHCDSAKGDRAITLNPTDMAHISTLNYSRDGRLSSDRETLNVDISEVLNLNTSALIERRRQALQSVKLELSKRYGDKEYPVAGLKKLLANYRTPTSLRRPFVGFLCWWLDRTVRKLSAP